MSEKLKVRNGDRIEHCQCTSTSVGQCPAGRGHELYILNAWCVVRSSPEIARILGAHPQTRTRHGVGPRASSPLLECALIVLWSVLPEKVAFDIRVAEQAVGINALDELDEVIEVRINLAQVVRSQWVSLRPVRLTGVAKHDLLEPREELPVRNVGAVRPANVRV